MSFAEPPAPEKSPKTGNPVLAAKKTRKSDIWPMTLTWAEHDLDTEFTSTDWIFHGVVSISLIVRGFNIHGMIQKGWENDAQLLKLWKIQ